MSSRTTTPRLALVLGSGGVRSLAALGLIEVLWREGVAPDLIVGCSAGAMCGALIAQGHPWSTGALICAGRQFTQASPRGLRGPS